MGGAVSQSGWLRSPNGCRASAATTAAPTATTAMAKVEANGGPEEPDEDMGVAVLFD